MSESAKVVLPIVAMMVLQSYAESTAHDAKIDALNESVARIERDVMYYRARIDRMAENGSLANN